MAYGDSYSFNNRVNLSHSYFLKADIENTVDIVFSPDSHKILNGKTKKYWNLFTYISIFVPLISVPILSIMFSNWWLMLGWVAAWIGYFLGMGASKILFILSLIFWGWHLNKYGFRVDSVTVFYLCMCFSLLFAFLARWMSNSVLYRAIKMDEGFYYSMIEAMKVLVVKKRNFIPKNYGIES